MEDALGAGLLMQAARGDNPYLIAALRSLPLLADDVSAADAAAMAAEGAAAAVASSADSSEGRGIAAATPQEKELAASLLAQVTAESGAPWATSLADDEQLLLQLSMRPPSLPEAAAAALGPLARDPRLLAALKYRVERKRLLAAAQVLLSVFVRD
jgi:hypothetical protein